MTTATKGLTKEQIVEWALSRGWTLDKWGHLQKTIGDNECRLKLSSIHVRREVKVSDGKGWSEWVRMGGAYLRDLSITDSGKLAGLK